MRALPTAISTELALPVGLWDKGFVGVTVKGSRCWNAPEAAPQRALGTAQAVLVPVTRQRG